MSGFWNYRVILAEEAGKEPLYQIHEVEYTSNGKVTNWSETGAAPFGHDIEELKADAERLKSAFAKPALKVVRQARGYELVEIESGEPASAEPPAGVQQ
ncbi:MULTISPECIES: hypothetical protein [Pseudoalteromonas]|uniref:Uncharacterized protein n=1 Tax=Pseudoalteromonas ruthenica TaxID=151081 RepID=A0A0F4Q0L9_9GAMM|nr:MULTISPECIES: hypothetical protein [Pseudoalteromonas]KJZ00905.1 hypothetical protein TW76_01525 [Pseudoalteromonas ruthenica]KJZ01043.1 hypothetical protein TW72_04080 [Pseudoalteromonas ruthenica]MCF2863206.1 hypothetical protein [Pseudoalteromonas sp. CNAT2-18]MCG7542930.1 hypothetical protein [Pseudoalteromonas sp. MM17-2]MCG7559358.1 hypothetical protein [Pseudoalteromonas sp. CNAT2-18.1]|tara:strand:+ start:96 stop:392 length:297 start_codon:yes stop_codon:yes gene_type:complete